MRKNTSVLLKYSSFKYLDLKMHDFPSKFSSIGRKREHIGPHEIFRALPSTKYLPNITVWGFPSFIGNFWRKHVTNGEHNGKPWKWDLAINHNNPWRTSNNFEALKREYIFHWHKKRIFIVASWVYFTKLFFHSFLNLIWEGLSQWFASQQGDVSVVGLTCSGEKRRRKFQIWILMF